MKNSELIDWIKKEFHISELDPPVPLEEILEIEDENGEELPRDYREYLLTVSSTLYFNYPMRWNESTLNTQACSLKMDTNFSELDSEDSMNGMITVSDRGCSFSYEMAINGPRKGSIWDCNGDALYYSFPSFTEWVESEIK